MRTKASSSMLKAKAIAGTHVVVLAWDLRPGQKSTLDRLLGFAIRRTEFDGNAQVESYTMRSIKRFRNKDTGLPPGELQQPVPENQRREHARHPRGHTRGGHLFWRVHADLRSPLCSLCGEEAPRA